jgi:iron(III) transport system ATP-binding protein
MRDGEIQQIGAPVEIYEDPNSTFVAGFVGKAAFFPVEIAGKEGDAWQCSLDGKIHAVKRAAPDVRADTKAVVMARPESLRLAPRGRGAIDGTVRMNVYLGHSIETFVETPYGEVLVQIDDPASKEIFPEGSPVSITLNEDRIRLLRA